MALYTILNKAAITALIEHFPTLPRTRFTAKGIALGTVNTYYRLRFTSGEVYYLKIDEVADESRLKNEVLIFEHLDKHRRELGHKTPMPILSETGARYVSFQKKFTLFIPEVFGVSYFKKDLTPERLAIIGRHIRRWHGIPTNKKIAMHRFDLPGQKNVFQQISSKLTRKHPELSRFIAAKIAFFERDKPSRERLRLIHADLFPENILWRGNRLNGILDFDAAGLGDPLFDVGVCLHALCHDGEHFHSDKIKGFLKGYFESKPPTLFEKQHFAYYFDLAAMRFLLTRLRDFELAPGPVKAEPFKDYREFSRRFDENEAFTHDIITPLLAH